MGVKFMDENTKINEMNITDEFIMVPPVVKGEVIAQNLFDLDEDGVILVTADGQKVNGFISRNEILDTLANGINPLEKTAADLLNTDFMTVSEDEILGNLMTNITKKYPKVIVVEDERGSCVGYFSKNDYNEAMIGLGYFDETVDPKTSEEWLARGIAKASQGKIEEALKCYENSLALHIDKERAWFELGKNFEVDKRFKDAILCYDRVISINPENEEAWINRGNIYTMLRMPDRAIQSYAHAVELNPRNDESMLNLGLAYCDIGNITNAINCFESVELNSGTNAKLLFFKGNAYNKEKNYTDAINCFDQAIKLNTMHEDAWFNKGAALHLVGNDKEAIGCFEQVLKINPYNESAREAIKICETKMQ